MLTVVAAVIRQGGRLLVCQRREDDTFGGKWEFPGGKVRPDETPAAALGRELHEELGVEARVESEVYRTRHRYRQHAEELELIFFAARLDGPPRNLAFQQILWAEPAALPGYDFLEADREFVAGLAAGRLPVR